MADESITSASVPGPQPPATATSVDASYPASIAFINNLQSPTTLFDGTNYVTWSAAFQRFLEIHGRLSHLTDAPPLLEAPHFSTWVIQDRAVTSWMLKMAIPAIAEPMQLISPSRAIWDEWARMYGYQSNIGRTVDIFEGLFKTKQAGRSLQDYYGSLRSLLTQLEVHQPYTTDIATQRCYREELAVALFLAGLDSPVSSQIRGPILSAQSLPTLGETFSTALRVSTGIVSPAAPLSSTESTALLSSGPRSRNRGSDGGRGRGRDGQGRGRGCDGQLYPPCEHCQRYGHRSDHCWEKFGKPAQMAHAITTTNTSSIAPDSLLISRAEYDRLMTTHTPAGGSPSGGSLTSHLASTSTSGTALLASPPGPWIIDSGASAHMSGTPSLLSRLSRLPNPDSVSIADGRVCPVAGKGLATPTSSLPLSDVLYVPNFPVNLLSISAITKTLFCSVYFFPYHCTFQDLRTGKRIGLGRETGRGLYELVPDTPSTGFRCLLSQGDSPLQWHRRLGHPGITKLRLALPWITLSTFECESCQLGKHFRSTYSRLDSIPSTHPFDLVHCDVWGPSRTSSISNFRYYIVFIDDFSRASWVYLLRDRTNVLPSVRQFLQEISTQYSLTPKILRTDNAMEFVQTALQDHCSSLGIIHQTSCPHTSQQNGVAERKHRHLLDMTCTLLVEMGVPHYLWHDALLTSAYLLNRLPSSPLGGEVPHRRLHPTRELFSLPPRVFGCVAFVHDHTPNLSKLSPRSIKGVFVGYSRTQKGYRVYLPDQRKYLVSADVTFFESTRYFSAAPAPPSPIPPPPPTSCPAAPPSTSSPDVAPFPPLLEAGSPDPPSPPPHHFIYHHRLRMCLHPLRSPSSHQMGPRPRPQVRHPLHCRPPTFIYPSHFAKVHVLVPSIPFLITSTMTTCTPPIVPSPSPSPPSRFLGPTWRLWRFHTGRRPWIRSSRLLPTVVHGSWFLVHRIPMLLPADGSSL